MLFRDVASKIAERPGGYTRILRTGTRLGDNAEMCFIELVDFNENMLGGKTPAKAKSTRRRGGKKKSAETTQAVADKTNVTDQSAEPTGDSAGEAKTE